MEDIDIDSKTLYVYKNYDIRNLQLTTTKTGNDRHVDIPKDCLNDIQELLNHYENNYTIKPDYCLLGLENRLTGTTINRHKKKYIKDAGLPHFTFHDLRHTHVSTLIQLGVRPIDISKRLGHSVEMVNNTYGHLFESDKENIINKLDNMM
ncbi:MAG: site-specific integrase [Erysipelothrix sp.]|nr:site-specific integrase [Erysipelothrix sp.]